MPTYPVKGRNKLKRKKIKKRKPLTEKQRNPRVKGAVVKAKGKKYAVNPMDRSHVEANMANEENELKRRTFDYKHLPKKKKSRKK